MKVVALLVSLGVLLVCPSIAGDTVGETPATQQTATPDDNKSQWRFRLAPYAWLTSTSGTIGAGPLSADAGMSSSDILSNLQIAAMFIAEVGYDKWSLENDLIYARFQSSKETPGPRFGALQSTLNQLMWTSLLGYRVVETERFTLDLQAGFRLISLGLELELTPGQLPGRSRYFNRTWIDPIVGFRSRTYLTDWLFVPIRGDIGGFGANSKLTWQAFAGLGAQITRWAAFIAGYRAIGYDYNQAGFSYNVITHGPAAGFEFKF